MSKNALNEAQQKNQDKAIAAAVKAERNRVLDIIKVQQATLTEDPESDKKVTAAVKANFKAVVTAIKAV